MGWISSNIQNYQKGIKRCSSFYLCNYFTLDNLELSVERLMRLVNVCLYIIENRVFRKSINRPKHNRRNFEKKIRKHFSIFREQKVVFCFCNKAVEWSRFCFKLEYQAARFLLVSRHQVAHGPGKQGSAWENRKKYIWNLSMKIVDADLIFAIQSNTV